MAQENEGQIKVRNVWASNLPIECDHIKNHVGSYSFASIKCKYPLHCSEDMWEYFKGPPEIAYDLLKLHIGNLPIIQLGLTLFNSDQELPVIEGHPTIWLFNFNMSDSNYCPKTLSEASLQRLDLRGIDLEINQKNGVDPLVFRDIIIESGFLWGERKVSTWVSFMGIYDFGYLVKVMMEKNIYPETLKEFLDNTSLFFGEIYDVKKMAEMVGVYGSLEEVRETIRVRRVQESEEANAGFDSHLTMQVFTRLKMHQRFRYGMEQIAGKFCGFSHSDIDSLV